jgi:hypothetical protein
MLLFYSGHSGLEPSGRRDGDHARGAAADDDQVVGRRGRRVLPVAREDSTSRQCASEFATTPGIRERCYKLERLPCSQYEHDCQPDSEHDDHYDLQAYPPATSFVVANAGDRVVQMLRPAFVGRMVADPYGRRTAVTSTPHRSCTATRSENRWFSGFASRPTVRSDSSRDSDRPDYGSADSDGRALQSSTGVGLRRSFSDGKGTRRVRRHDGVERLAAPS